MAGANEIGRFDIGGVKRPDKNEIQPWQYQPRRLLLLPFGEYQLPLLREEIEYPVNGESPSFHRHYIVVGEMFPEERVSMIYEGTAAMDNTLQEGMPVITTIPSQIKGRVDDYVVSDLFVYKNGVLVPQHYRLGRTIALASLDLVVNPRIL